VNSRQRRRLRRVVARIMVHLPEPYCDNEVTDQLAQSVLLECKRLAWIKRGGDVFHPGSKKTRRGEITRRAKAVSRAWAYNRECGE